MKIYESYINFLITNLVLKKRSSILRKMTDQNYYILRWDFFDTNFWRDPNISFFTQIIKIGIIRYILTKISSRTSRINVKTSRINLKTSIMGSKTSRINSKMSRMEFKTFLNPLSIFFN